MKKLLFVSALLLSACSINVPKELEQKKDAGQSVLLECEVNTQKELCKELGILTCAKIASCSVTRYEECLELFDKNNECLAQDQRAVSKCIADFADIDCIQDLPESCYMLE